MVRDDAVNSLYSSLCCVLCAGFIYILSANTVIKSVLVFHRNDAGMLQSQQTEFCDVLRCFWANFYGIRGDFFHCLKYFVYCTQMADRGLGHSSRSLKR